MSYSILFLGDVMGRSGRNAIKQGVPSLLESYQPDFLIINGENAAGGVGITPEIAKEFFAVGADVVTLGNHAFNKREIIPYFKQNPHLIRPLNMPEGTPGAGITQVTKAGVTLHVVNACGRVFMEGYNDPFAALKAIRGEAQPHLFIDFHGEATSEKVAMGWFMDGYATAVVGTHTHIQTADERILPEGTAYITDVGMSGPQNGVIGMDRDIVLGKFLTSIPARFEVAEGPGVLHGVVVRASKETGRAESIERIRFAT